MTEIINFFQRYLHLSVESQVQLAETLGVLVILTLLRLFLVYLVNRSFLDVNVRYRWRKAVEYLIFFGGAFIIIEIWIEEVSALSTYFGLLSAGIAVSLSDILMNWVGWLRIVSRQPFQVGDRIEIGGVAGDVVDVRFFSFTLVEIRNWVEADQSTGRLVHVPNRWIFSETIANYTTGFHYVWHEMPVVVTFESDWRGMKELLLEVLHEHADHIVPEAVEETRLVSKKVTIKFGKLTPIVYTSVDAHGIRLTMRFLCEPRRRRSTTSAVWEDVLDRLAGRDDIQLAYPTQRIYANWNEQPTPPPAP